MRPKILLFVVNVDWGFISHRLILGKEALKHGFEVHVACTDTGKRNVIEKEGIHFHDIKFERSGKNPLNEMNTIYSLYKLYYQLKPDVIHHSALKAVTYGAIIARMLNIPSVNAINGLGYTFTNRRLGISAKILIQLLKYGMKNKNIIVIFQNKDDEILCKNLGFIYKSTEVIRIKGAGVNLTEFKYTEPVKKDRLVILFPARLLWDKGVKEFCEAAEHLKSQYGSKLQMRLVGRADIENLSGLSEKNIKSLEDGEYLKWAGNSEKMNEEFINCDVVVLPSYREGMPKSLLEACATGRPIVTTNAIGCRECVDEGINGYKVDIKDSISLSKAIEILILNEDIRIKMGRAGREKAVKEFNIDDVIKTHVEIYKKLSKKLFNHS